MPRINSHTKAIEAINEVMQWCWLAAPRNINAQEGADANLNGLLLELDQDTVEMLVRVAERIRNNSRK